MRTTCLLLVLVVVMAGSGAEAQLLNPWVEAPATQPAGASTAARALTQGRVVAEIEKCGGTVERYGDTPDAPVVVVHFYGKSSDAVTDTMLERLKELNQLQVIYLGNAINVTDAGLEHLKGLSELRVLSLTGAKVTDAGLEHLKGLSELKHVKLTSTKVTDEGVKKLQEALPKCTISHLSH